MSKQIKVGLFVLVGILLATAIVFTIGESRRVWSRKDTYTASFADVVGLKAGAPVRMGGFDVGNVTMVAHSDEVTDSRIYIQMSIAKSEAVRIRQDTVAKIANKGLLGDKMVELTVSDGKAPALDPAQPMKSEEPMDFSKYIAKFESIAEKTDKVAANLERLTGAIGDQEFADDMKGTLKSLREILDGVSHTDGVAHRMIFDPETAKKIDRTLTNIESTTTQMNTAMADARDVTAHMKNGPGLVHALVYDGEMSASAAGAVSELHKDMVAVREGNGIAHALLYGDSNTQQVMGNVNAMSGDLRQIIANMKAGKGTLGALLVDPSVYEDIKGIVGNVDRNEVLRALVRYSIKADEVKPPAAKVETAPKR